MAVANQRPEPMNIEPSGALLGAFVRGVDLSAEPSAEQEAALRAAWAQHLVLVFRDQTLSAPQYLRAIKIFGSPRPGAVRKYYEDSGTTDPSASLGVPEITILSNLDASGRPVEQNDSLGSQEVVWHSDNSYIDRPPAGSTLYALEIPPDGSGQTSFANQYVAYEQLADDVKQAIHGRFAKHDASRNSAGVLRPGVKLPTNLDEVPGPMHPLVRVHPVTQKPALYLGRRRKWPSQFINDCAADESERLLDHLWREATRPVLTWTHQWQVGDVLVWDNRCTMHYRKPVNSSHRRVMWRSQFSGEVVSGAHGASA